MTQDNDKDDRRLGLSTAQVVGSALAAMSGALVASLAGTTGTLIGAAVGSVIATVGATMYTESLRRTGSAAKKTAAVVRQRGALITGALPRTVAEQSRDGAGDAGPAPVSDGSLPREVDEEDPGGRRWDLPWGKVAIASLAVMLTGLAGITAVEAVTGQPISSLLGGDNEHGTTVGHVVGTNSKKKSPRHQSPASQQPQPQPQPQPSSAPSQQPPGPDQSTSSGPSDSSSDAPSTLPDTQAPAG